MALTIPDIHILETCNKILTILRDDYNQNILNSTESNSLLYILFNSLALGRYDFYENVKSLIVTTPENPKHIDTITTSFDHNHNKVPHIFLTLPAESTSNNSIGIGEGDYDEIIINNDFPEQDEYRKQFNRRYICTYYLVIVTENRGASLVLYHLFKNMLVACTNHLHLIGGLQNLKIGGQDIRMDNQVPDKVFTKAVTLNFEYEQSVPEILVKGIYDRLLLYTQVKANPDIYEVTRTGPIDIDSDDSDSDSFT
jgi:hypothetical protein